jgi:hypothetical protein
MSLSRRLVRDAAYVNPQRLRDERSRQPANHANTAATGPSGRVAAPATRRAWQRARAAKRSSRAMLLAEGNGVEPHDFAALSATDVFDRRDSIRRRTALTSNNSRPPLESLVELDAGAPHDHRSFNLLLGEARSGAVVRRSPLRLRGSLLDQLLNPSEAPLPAESGLRWIALTYSRARSACWVGRETGSDPTSCCPSGSCRRSGDTSAWSCDVLAHSSPICVQQTSHPIAEPSCNKKGPTASWPIGPKDPELKTQNSKPSFKHP